jgi:hypothetical protein
VLRLAVGGVETDLESIAVAKLPSSLPEAVFGDKLNAELSQFKALFSAGTSNMDLKSLAYKCQDAFRTVKQTAAETQTVRKPHSVAAYRLFEMNRNELKETLAPAVKEFSKSRGWDDAKVLAAVNKCIDSLPNDG